VPGTGVVAVVEEEKEEDNNKEVVDDEFGIDDDYNEEFRHEERQTKRYLHKNIFPSKHVVKHLFVLTRFEPKT
jgi:hypothetical protein